MSTSNFFRNVVNRVQRFTGWSTPAVPDSGWACCDFMLGVGMVILQPSTNKMVVVFDENTKTCFLPRGRKDMGESLQQAALREAYEESGFEVEFLPLYLYNHQPPPPNDKEARHRPNTEAIYTTVTSWNPRKNVRRQIVDHGGEYLVFWYLGQIPENAVHHEGVGMPDEQGYRSHLVTVEQAMGLLTPSEAMVVSFAWAAYQSHLEHKARLEKREAEALTQQSTTKTDGTSSARTTVKAESSVAS